MKQPGSKAYEIWVADDQLREWVAAALVTHTTK
jgi:hypothetical protein